MNWQIRGSSAASKLTGRGGGNVGLHVKEKELPFLEEKAFRTSSCNSVECAITSITLHIIPNQYAEIS